MAKDKYIEQIFPIKCRGRDEARKEVLSEPVEVFVNVHQSPGVDTSISASVKCQYNTGGHGQRCKASHPYVDKKRNGVICPFSFDVPYIFDSLDNLHVS